MVSLKKAASRFPHAGKVRRIKDSYYLEQFLLNYDREWDNGDKRGGHSLHQGFGIFVCVKMVDDCSAVLSWECCAKRWALLFIETMRANIIDQEAPIGDSESRLQHRYVAVV